MLRVSMTTEGDGSSGEEDVDEVAAEIERFRARNANASRL